MPSADRHTANSYDSMAASMSDQQLSSIYWDTILLPYLRDIPSEHLEAEAVRLDVACKSTAAFIDAHNRRLIEDYRKHKKRLERIHIEEDELIDIVDQMSDVLHSLDIVRLYDVPASVHWNYTDSSFTRDAARKDRFVGSITSNESWVLDADREELRHLELGDVRQFYMRQGYHWSGIPGISKLTRDDFTPAPTPLFAPDGQYWRYTHYSFGGQLIESYGFNSASAGATVARSTALMTGRFARMLEMTRERALDSGHGGAWQAINKIQNLLVHYLREMSDDRWFKAQPVRMRTAADPLCAWPYTWALSFAMACVRRQLHCWALAWEHAGRELRSFRRYGIIDMEVWERVLDVAGLDVRSYRIHAPRMMAQWSAVTGAKPEWTLSVPPNRLYRAEDDRDTLFQFSDDHWFSWKYYDLMDEEKMPLLCVASPVEEHMSVNYMDALRDKLTKLGQELRSVNCTSLLHAIAQCKGQQVEPWQHYGIVPGTTSRQREELRNALVNNDLQVGIEFSKVSSDAILKALGHVLKTLADMVEQMTSRIDATV